MTRGDLLRTVGELTDQAWLVGGALRDELLGRETIDLDVAVAGETRGLARGLARAHGAHAFELSEAFGAWRVSVPDGAWQVDLVPLLGDSLSADLARRDLTVNAIARPVTGGELIDPHGGVADLQRRRLRMVSERSFRDDPLRVMRLARLAAGLNFEIDPATEEAARAAVEGLGATPGERIFAEMRQIVAGPAPLRGLELLDRFGVTEVILPELSALSGVGQSVYHHRDVHGHTLEALAALVELEADPSARFGLELGARLSEFFAEPFADGLTRGGALRFGTLLHDIAKPETRAENPEGRVTFTGHDVAGAQIGHAILTRLRTSDRLAGYVSALTRYHLRLGFLVHEAPLDRRGVYRYLSACEPVEVDVTLLSVADRLATRGRNSDRAIASHLELVTAVLPAALDWHQARPRPPIRGDRLAVALGIRPGPDLGALLGELTEAAYAGEVDGEESAVQYARRALER